MTWTTEKPSQPGWYWYRDKRQPQHVRVIEIMACDVGTEGFYQEYGEWAGPMEPPPQ